MSNPEIDLNGEVRVWLGPESTPALEAAVIAGGGEIVEYEQANTFVWHGPCPLGRSQAEALAAEVHDQVKAVQLDSVGIDGLISAGLIDDRRLWLAAADVYSNSVAEHGLTLLLAAVKRLPETARASGWSEIYGRELADMTVGVHGAGAIGRRIIELLSPFGCEVLAVNTDGRDVAGATRAYSADRTLDLFRESDAVILCSPLTEATRGLVGDEALSALGEDGILVNVARGALVDTGALVRTLTAGEIAGAALDVTEPEPLPEDHPLWGMANVLITPHVANTYATYERHLAKRVEKNIGRLVRGETPIGVVRPERGY